MVVGQMEDDARRKITQEQDQGPRAQYTEAVFHIADPGACARGPFASAFEIRISCCADFLRREMFAQNEGSNS